MRVDIVMNSVAGHYQALLLLLIIMMSTIVTAGPVQFNEEASTMLDKALEKASPETRQCVACHVTYTPFIVMDWLRSKMAWKTPSEGLKELYNRIGRPDILEKVNPRLRDYKYTVGCYECHSLAVREAAPDRPDLARHFNFEIASIVTLKSCSQCHPKEAMELSWTWHSFAALNGPLKPWYSRVVKYAKDNGRMDMLPPVYEKTGKELVTWEWYKGYARKILEGRLDDPEVESFGTPYDYDFKNIVSPLYPASGVLNTTVMPLLAYKASILGIEVSSIMEHPRFMNSYVYHACLQCHGSMVIPYKKEMASVENLVTGATNVFERVEYWGWPSNGAGRIDPDGSLGTCTACHTRHEFSIKQAREPWTCGQCHIGYDHPHIEIYEESKHGNILAAHGDEWNWTAQPWRVGVHFNSPTCAACHMSTLADKDGNILVYGTHDFRKRLVWDQMHFFSYPKPKWPDLTQNAIIKGGSQLNGKGLIENRIVVEGYRILLNEAPKPGELRFPRLATIEYYGELAEKRVEMKKVCNLCHSRQWVDNYFRTFDQNIIDYNITAQYAFQLLQKAYQQGIHDPKNKIDEYMEIMWYYIWHHDGRRWRNGAAMMGPDYAHWYGIVDTVMDKLGRMSDYYNTVVQLVELKGKAGLAPPEEMPAIQAKINELENKIKKMESEVPVMKSALDNIEEMVNQAKSTADEASMKADEAMTKASEIEESLNNIVMEQEELKSKVEEASKPTPLILAIIALIIALIAAGFSIRRT